MLGERGRRGLAWGVFSLSVAVVAVGSAFLLAGLAHGSITPSQAIGQFSLLPPAAAFSIVGLIVALRQPSNACGWLMLAIGAMWSLGVSPPTPNGSRIEWATSWAWVPPFGLMATHLPLRLPDGNLPSPRWRIVSRLSTTAIVVTCVGFLFDPEVTGNPIANRGMATLGLLGLILLAVCALLSISSLVVRARRGSADEKHQIRWIAAGAAVFFLGWLLSFVASALFPGADTAAPSQLVSAVTLFLYAAIPVGIGIAILKYRLYDIDVVIRKAVVVATLAVFFTAVYALVVGVVGAFVGSRSTAGLSFVAAALVAVGFQPVLGRARRFADRVVYGERATPYEVLTSFSQGVAETYADEDVLERMATVVGEGIGAASAEVWLRVDDTLRVAASWPETENGDRRTIRIGHDDVSIPGADAVFPIEHRGQMLGVLSVSAPANDPVDPAKTRLVSDLASQAGLVLRSVRLSAELRARLNDLQAAQKRLVAAQDEERRRIERDIHDGAQQQLVSIAMKVKLADSMVDRNAGGAHALLEQLGSETRQALDDLRQLARGIYPPLLADRGLTAALEAHARRASVDVRVDGSSLARYQKDVEAAVYFSCLEALQNVAKYAHASRADVRLSQQGGRLTFEVADDGRGFDLSSAPPGSGLQGMADRLGALGGGIQVTSEPGEGTTLAGWIPAEPLSAQPPSTDST